MSRLRVLVVDDSLTVRKRIAEALARRPEFEVVGEAEDGKRGIELCLSLKPDVMTLDMMMPQLSGLAATEYIMAYCPTPILIVSASTNRGELFKTYEALAAGAVDVLDKSESEAGDGAWEEKLACEPQADRAHQGHHPSACAPGAHGPPRRPGSGAPCDSSAAGRGLAGPGHWGLHGRPGRRAGDIEGPSA